MNKKLSVFHRICAAALCCCMLLGLCPAGLSAAATASQIGTYISKTYEFEKGTDTTVLTDAEAKTALTEETDLLILAAGRDTAGTFVTDGEFETYLGYINVNLRSGNGSYKSIDFLRGALAAGAAGADPTNLGKDANGNGVNLFYKGLYTRSLTTLEKEGAKTLAYALLALDANEIRDTEMRASGSKVTRGQLKNSLIASANSLSNQAVPDAGTSALILAALAPYYRAHEGDVVTAVDTLLVKLAGLQSADGSIKDSTAATANLIVALCAMDIDPAANTYFTYDLHEGLMKFYNAADGGFSPGSSSTKSDDDATAAARCALVAYYCFDRGELFFDFSSVKAHSVKSIASATTTTNKNTSSTTNKNTSSSSTTNKSASSSSSNKSTSGSSSSTKESSSAGSNTRSASGSTTTVSGGEVVTKDKFEAIKGTDEVYLYEGTWGEEEPYTLSFNGKDITTPMDFTAGLSNVANHQLEIDAAADNTVEYITFLHKGAFPGKATATVTVSLPDGSYNCYHYNESTATFDAVGSVIVANSMVSFDVTEGGEYFITAGTAKVSMEDLEMAVGDTVDGVVPASTFEDIQGKNTDLVLSGETDRGVRYEITFNGMDITAPLDFNMRILESTDHWDGISQLAEGPLVLNFAHSGVLPGPAEVKFYANLDASVNYGLYYYNPAENTGVYSGAIEVGDGEFTFTIYHCSEYFIAEYTGEDTLTAPSFGWLIIVIVVVVILIGGGIGGFLLYRRWGKEGFAARVAALKGKFGGKIGKKGKKAKNTAEGQALPAEEGEGSEGAEREFAEVTESAAAEAEPSADEAVSPYARPLDDETSAEAAAADVPAEELPAEPEEAPVKERDYASFMRPASKE